MPLKPGNYFVISALIRNEIMFLREGEGNLWSRTLREARFFLNEERANEAKKAARQSFSKYIVRGIQVVNIDVFGTKKNWLVSLA